MSSLPEYKKLRNTIQAAVGKEHFELIAINVDATRAEAEAFLKTMYLDFPLPREESGATQRKYKLIGMPTAFVIDRQGWIRMRYQGFHIGYLEKIVATINMLLKENTAK